MDIVKSGSSKAINASGSPRAPKRAKPKVGRPRLGTEAERMDALLDHALFIFMRKGYAFTSVAKIAAAAGVSTRTIYQHYGNKADLMVAAVSRMMHQDMQSRLDIKGILLLPPEEALYSFGEFLLQQVIRPDIIELYRMGASEAYRFPELVAKMESSIPERIVAMIAEYMTHYLQAHCGLHGGACTRLPYSLEAAARLFMYMLIAEPRHRGLFGQLDHQPEWDQAAHVKLVVQVFLHGFMPAATLEQGSTSNLNT